MLKDYEFSVLTSIVDYYLSLCNRKIKIITNNNDQIDILFNKKDVCDLTKLNEYYKHDNGGKCNELKVIFERIINGEKVNIPLQEEQRISEVCFNFKKISNMNLNTIHSVIDYNNKKYILVNSRHGITAMELEQKSRKGTIYYVINKFLSKKEIENLINEKKAYISIPKYFDTVDLGSEDISFANDTVVTYTTKRSDYAFKNQILNDDVLSLKLLELKELIYSSYKTKINYKDFSNKFKTIV